MSKSKNDIAWEKIFEKYCILDKLANNERISISSTEINQFREARLMTKFDHRSQLPKLFIDHNLSILPTSRGTYEIGKFKTFCDFNKDDIEITPIDFPTFLESIDYKDITSESIAINCAFVSKILHDGGYHYKTKYEVGEVVAVAQSYEAAGFDPGYCIEGGQFAQKHAGWHNKMFVKPALMSHRIRITGIKCERLQDISDEDCFREGISESWYESTDTTTYGYADEKKGTAVEFDTPRKAFAALIDKVSGRGTWASNPWVVVYEFELVK